MNCAICLKELLSIKLYYNYVYNVDEVAVTTFSEKPGKLTMEKCTIAYLVSLKCAESKRYKSNCLLCQRCWLLCTSCGEHKAARTCEDLQTGAPPGFFNSTQRTAVSANNIVLQNIMHYCTCKATFSYVVLAVQKWKQCGPLMKPQYYEWTSCKV